MKTFSIFSLYFTFTLLFALQYSNYDINAKLDDKLRIIHAEETLEFVNNFNHPINHIYFTLQANLGEKENPYLSKFANDMGYENGFEPTRINVLNVTHENSKLKFEYLKGLGGMQKYSLERAILNVYLPKNIKPLERIKVKIKFETLIPEKKGDEGYYDGMFLWRFGWFPLEMQVKNNEWYLSHSSAPFMYKAEITVPAEYTVISGGDEVKEIATPDDRTGTFILSSSKFAVSLPLCIVKDSKTYGAEALGININATVRRPPSWFLEKPRKNEAEQILDYAKSALEYYNKNFGKYKWKKLEVIESTDEGAGMAADGFVLMPDLFYIYKNLISPGLMEKYVDYVLAHEIAHTYYGLGVNMDFVRDNYMSESFAQYMSISYIEDKYGPTDNVFTLNFIFKYFLYNYLYATSGMRLPRDNRKDMAELPYRATVQNGTDEGVVKEIKDMKHLEESTVFWYDKGYLVNRALSKVVGIKTFNEGLKEIFESSNGLSYTPEMLIAVMEKKSGKDLTQFRKDWILGDKNIDYSIRDLDSEPSGKGYKTIIKVKNFGTGTLPADLVAYNEDKVVAAKEITVNPGKEEKIIFETDKKVDRASLDENEYTLDVDRRDNYYPRKPPQFGIIFDPVTSDQYFLTFDFYLASKNGIEFRGGYLNDHQWKLGLFKETYAKDIAFYNPSAAFMAKIGRDKYWVNSFNYYAVNKNKDLPWEDVNHRISYYNMMTGISLPFYTSREIGMEGTYNEAANIFNLMLSFTDFKNIMNTTHENFNDLDRKEFSLVFNYLRNDITNLAWANMLNVQYFLDTYEYLFKITSTKYFKPLGKLLIEADGEYGYSTPLVTKPNQFNLTFMNIFDSTIRGHTLVHAKAEATYKLFRAKKTRLCAKCERAVPFLNFLVFEGGNVGAYVEGADVFDQDGGETPSMKYAFGPEFHLLTSTLLEMPLDLKLVYSIPAGKYDGSRPAMSLNLGARF